MGESFKVGTPQIVFLLFLTKSCGLLLALLVQTNQDGPPAPPKKKQVVFRASAEPLLPHLPRDGPGAGVCQLCARRHLRARTPRAPTKNSGALCGLKMGRVCWLLGFLVCWFVGFISVDNQDKFTDPEAALRSGTHASLDRSANWVCDAADAAAEKLTD